MVCESCGEEFTEDFRKSKNRRKLPMRFCSQSCASGASNRKYTEETFCLYCGASLGIGCTGHSKKYCNQEHAALALQQAFLDRWLSTGIPNNFTGGGRGNTIPCLYVRRYIIEEQKHYCAICGDPDIWKGSPLRFVLDHTDGDSTNNRRENLRLICPNCNSQTSTFSGHNRGKGRKARGFPAY